MNKQDLKEGQEVYVKGRVIHTGDHLDIVLDNGSFIENAIILHHKKPVIPQMVADYIEFKKEQNFHVYGAMRVIEGHYDKRVPDWFYEGNIETFARAWLDGYEVEEEKRYLVKMKGIVNALSFLSYHKNADIWTVTDKNNSDGHRAHHTRKQLEEAGFGWVFDCEGIEIEEVE